MIMKSIESRQHLSNIIAATGLASVALLASGCSANTAGSEPNGQPSTTQDFVAGCNPYTVLAQNRWPLHPYTDTYGAAVRTEPVRIPTNVIGSVAGNSPIVVDGWRHTGVQVYAQNPGPFNSDVWFHTTSKDWVSFAGVRGAETSRNPSGLDPKGGVAAPLDPKCEIK